ncbi:MAG: FtsW/RodA/SpoVE family cell cycle protein, partial [Lachnospiraceae bacterium]|nr:FtsW/RodA/SpoVE family cell cycle protein [Lachnospiraceae bacterium]
DQIRCVKARVMVGDEIRTHIEDQALAYQEQGMEEAQALEAAVREMGDPVETGMSMDRIHRPEIAWGMIALMAVIGLVSIGIHTMFGLGDPELGMSYVKIQIGCTLTGFLAMICVCIVDYSFLAVHGTSVAAGFTGIFLLMWFFLGKSINGSTRWIHVAGSNVAMMSLIYLFVPLYGAVLFQYRKEQARGMVKSLLWIGIVLVPAYLMNSLGTQVSLAFILLTLFSVAVARKWFGIKRPKRFLAVLWGCVIFSGPAYLLFLSMTGQVDIMQSRRIRMFLGLDPENINYTRYAVLDILKGSRLIRTGNRGFSEFIGVVPAYNEEYVLASLAASFGFAAMAVLAALLGFMVFSIFRIAFRQKNELGMMISCGCGMNFTVLILICIFENVGLLPHMSFSLPFISAGGTNIIVSYIMAGIVLSVHRYKSVLPKELPGKVKLWS